MPPKAAAKIKVKNQHGEWTETLVDMAIDNGAGVTGTEAQNQEKGLSSSWVGKWGFDHN
jgi:hypothetical protein